MKILERRTAFAHWKELNIGFAYNIEKGVKLKRSVKITVSGELLSKIQDQDVGKLLQRLSLVFREKDEPVEKTPGVSVPGPVDRRSRT